MLPSDFAVGLLSLLASTVPRILRKHLVERTSLCCSGLTVKWLPSALLAEVSLFHSLVHAPPHLRPSVPKLLAALASFRLCLVKSPEHDSVPDGIQGVEIVLEKVFFFRFCVSSSKTFSFKKILIWGRVAVHSPRPGLLFIDKVDFF